MGFIPRHIVERLDFLQTEEVAERLLGRRVSNHSCLCFMHNDHDPSLKFFGKDHQSWRCFVCDEGGYGPISLVMKIEGVRFSEACRILCDMYGIILYDEEPRRFRNYGSVHKRIERTYDYSEPMQENVFAKDVPQWIVSNSILSDKAKHFLFAERHFSESVVESLNIGSISNPIILRDRLRRVFSADILNSSGLVKPDTGNIKLFTPCLIFPYYDINGELIGLQSRYLGEIKDSPRFQFTSKQKSRLYNMPILRDIEKGADLYIAEGVTDCIALLSSGLNAVAIPSATLFPEEDLYILKDYNLKMYPDVDKDNTGLKCYYRIESYMIRLGGKIKKLSLPDGIKDYGDYYSSLAK